MTATFDRWAVKATRPDFTTMNGFRWAYPGEWTTDPAYTGNDLSDGVCPTGPGDGLSVAKTVRGMASGGYSPSTVLVVGFNQGDVICEDDDKLRVVKAFTFDVWDGVRLVRDHGRGADLYGADLSGVRHNAYTRWPEGFDMSRLEE